MVVAGNGSRTVVDVVMVHLEWCHRPDSEVELLIRLAGLYFFFASDAARGRVESSLQVFSVYIAQLLNLPCLSSTAISKLNTRRVILDSRWSSTLLTGVDGVRHC